MTVMTQTENINVEQRLKDKVAIITGGGSGIGRATALRLAQQGAKVCLFDLKENKAAAVKEEIEQQQGNAMVVDVDLQDPQRIKEGYEAVIQNYGTVDILFANAGINGILSPIEDLPVEEWDKTLNTNLRGTFLTVKFAIPHLKKQGGSIIITSSINGSRVFSNFGFSAYSTSKAGQIAFGKMAALELAKFNIRVNIICPGAIKTNISESTQKTPQLKEIETPIQYPLGDKPLEHGPGQPEQVADLVLFLSSWDSRHITGTEIYIDGAESLL
jgi:NAD(P)-dependent dehydrogenase (short-subunit alcohol dehydrogenase family)